MAQAVEEWYKQMPVITRSYLTATIVTTVGCSLDFDIKEEEVSKASPNRPSYSPPDQKPGSSALC